MDGFRRRIIKNLKMWTEVDGWTDGRKSFRGGLIRCSNFLFHFGAKTSKQRMTVTKDHQKNGLTDFKSWNLRECENKDRSLLP